MDESGNGDSPPCVCEWIRCVGVGVCVVMVEMGFSPAHVCVWIIYVGEGLCVYDGDESGNGGSPTCV